MCFYHASRHLSELLALNFGFTFIHLLIYVHAADEMNCLRGKHNAEAFASGFITMIWNPILDS